MPDPNPLGPGDGGDDPFRGIPFFGDLARMLGGPGGGFRWDAVRHLALQVATEGRSEPNPDPLERIQLEQLVRVAELHVGATTGLPTSTTGQPLAIEPVTRAMWVHHSADAYRPLFEALAASIAADAAAPGAPSPDDAFGAGADDPMSAMLGSLMGAMAPMLLSMTAGSMLGHLAMRSFGQYDLPVPRPAGDRLMIVTANLAAFGDAWSLPRDDLRLWVCLHEVAHHAVLGVAHVRAALDALLREYAAGFSPDPRALEDRLGSLSIDPGDPQSLISAQQAIGDPEILLGAIRSDAQRALLPRLEALVTVIVGYVDHVMDTVGDQLIASYGMLTEALRRRRVETDPSDRFVERLLGLELTQAAYARGEAFISGVVKRAGPEALERLWADERSLPTPAEVDAPGLWLARIDL